VEKRLLANPTKRVRRYATAVKKERRTGNWTPDGAAERAAARRDFRELTPVQRVEQAIELSRVLTRLAETGRQQRLG